LKNQIDTEEVKKLIAQIHNTFDELEKLRAQSKEELSQIDRDLSNHYHNIEGTEINNMIQSHIMMMKLKEILFARRDAKINHTLLESFVSALERIIVKTKKRFSEIIEKHDEIIQEIIDRSNDTEK